MEPSNSSAYAEWVWKEGVDPYAESSPDEWCSYSEEECRIIESAYRDGKDRVRLNNRYRIDLAHLVQVVIEDPGRRRPIKRIMHNKRSWIKLESKLGEGGFGIVYQGIYRNSQRVACKITKTQLSEADKNEIDVLKALHHPNITRYIDVIYTSREMWLVMELIDGGTLFSYIRNTSESCGYWCTIRNILLDVAYGMSYLHEKRIVHADLKSDNILIRRNEKAVVSDFGLSRMIEGAGTRYSSADKGACRWLAPELCSDRPESSSFPSDVWAFGCVILESITKKWPWQREYTNIDTLLHALRKETNARYFQEICDNQRAPTKIRALLRACCTWPKRNRPDFVNIIGNLSSISDGDLEPRDRRPTSHVQNRDRTASAKSIREPFGSYRNKNLYSSDDNEGNFPY